MKRKIFFRTFFLTVVCCLLVFMSGIFSIEQSSRATARKRLEEQTQILCNLVRTQEDIRRLSFYGERRDFRVTVIRPDGTVLFESDRSEGLENHANREEVRHALAGDPITVERYSDTFGCQMMYYAVQSTLDDGEKPIFRIAVRVGEISPFLGVTLPLLLVTLILALILGALVARKLSDDVCQKMQAIAHSLHSLNEGNYHPLHTDSREHEFYAVFQQINDLNRNLRDHMAAQRNESEKLNAVLDNITEGILALDSAAHIVFVNRAAIALLSPSVESNGKDHLAGRSLSYLVEDSALCERMRTCHGADTWEYEQRGQALRISFHEVTDKTCVGQLCSIVIIQDITTQRRIAREKSDFFANASHELKTPLTVVQGNAELILSKCEADSPLAKQAERIRAQAVRMNHLVADMLKLSSLEQGRNESTELAVNLPAVAREVIAGLQSRICEKHLTVRVVGEGEVYAAPEKMYELLENLLSNAVSYNRDGGSIDVCVSTSEEGVRLLVRDNGIGIAPEHVPRLGERFYRVDRSRSRKTGGTGLGLAIVKHICMLYGTLPKIQSEVDVGTSVTIDFPRKKEKQE